MMNNSHIGGAELSSMSDIVSLNNEDGEKAAGNGSAGGACGEFDQNQSNDNDYSRKVYKAKRLKN